MAVSIPDELREVADQVNQGTERSETVRTLLSWFHAERRAYWKVRDIRKALTKLKLKTEPDFEDPWIDAKIVFLPKVKKEKAQPPSQPTSEPEDDSLPNAGVVEPVGSPKAADDLHSRIKVGVLTAANTPPTCVSPDADISEAITLMLQNDYSQLPVTTTPNEVKGMISWKNLGSRLALGNQCKKVRECMEPSHEIRDDASLFEAIQLIVEHECILVRDRTRKLKGLVTTADLSIQFAKLGEPFLLLGQIENHIRSLIGDKFTKAELASVRDPGDSGREIEDVSDLTFGEYGRLLEDPKRWEKFSVAIHRGTFIAELKRIGDIRNDVMHFHPDGVGPSDLDALRRSLKFLGDLEKKLLKQ